MPMRFLFDGELLGFRNHAINVLPRQLPPFIT
jgi:hypothetical protein